jgi:hypothetical protein
VPPSRAVDEDALLVCLTPPAEADKARSGLAVLLAGLVKHYQLQVSRSGLIAFSKPAVLKIAVTGLSL